MRGESSERVQPRREEPYIDYTQRRSLFVSAAKLRADKHREKPQNPTDYSFISSLECDRHVGQEGKTVTMIADADKIREPHS